MSGVQPLTTGNAKEFWTAAWQMQRTGWKGGEVSPPFVRNIYVFLTSLLPSRGSDAAPFPWDVRSLGDAGNDTFNGPEEQAAVRAYVTGKVVLVPLCGDTPALPFFVSHGAAMVIGADLSAQGLAAQRASNFPDVAFASTVVRAGVSAEDQVTLYEATVEGTVVRLFEGDFLTLPEVSAFSETKVDFVYDRASFMAMNPALRGAYVRVVAGQLKPETPLLVERPVRKEGDLSGPPFTFSKDVVRELYEGRTGRTFDVETILQYRWGEVRDASPSWIEFLSVRPRMA